MPKNIWAFTSVSIIGDTVRKAASDTTEPAAKSTFRTVIAILLPLLFRIYEMLYRLMGRSKTSHKAVRSSASHSNLNAVQREQSNRPGSEDAVPIAGA